MRCSVQFTAVAGIACASYDNLPIAVLLCPPGQCQQCPVCAQTCSPHMPCCRLTCCKHFFSCPIDTRTTVRSHPSVLRCTCTHACRKPFALACGQLEFCESLRRRDPNHPSVSHLKTLPTARGTKLIISGWWGTARHINYFGDWIMGCVIAMFGMNLQFVC